MKDLGLNIKRIRRQKKMSQEQLGRIVGVEKNTISGYERNAIKPSAKSLLGISEALGVSIDDLMGVQVHYEGDYAYEKSTASEPDAPHYTLDDLELRIEAVEKRLNLLSRELADLKLRYENKEKG
jgi:transcriptional regulator with XRE-family HTH domain